MASEVTNAPIETRSINQFGVGFNVSNLRTAYRRQNILLKVSLLNLSDGASFLKNKSFSCLGLRVACIRDAAASIRS